jgi:hypothetical protein
VSICSFISNAQIPGVDVFPRALMFDYNTHGNVVEFDYYRCGESIKIELDFEQEDNYYATVGHLDEPLFNGSLTQDSFSTRSYILDLDVTAFDYDTVKVYGEDQGLVIQLVSTSRLLYLESITLESSVNNIMGDTIFICGDIGTDYIYYITSSLDIYEKHYNSSLIVGPKPEFTYIDDELYDDELYYNNSLDFHVNDTIFSPETRIKDFNFKTGDVIKIEQTGYFIDDIGCWWNVLDTISSPELIVKIVENEKLDLIDTIGEFYGGICHDEPVILTKENDFRWYKKNNSSYSYTSHKDSFLVKTPGEYLLIEDLPLSSDKQCPSMSEVMEINIKSGCKGYVSGYVKQALSHNKLSGIMVSIDKGQTTVSDENGFYEFYFDMDDAPTYIVISQDGYYEDKEYLSFSNTDF